MSTRTIASPGVEVKEYDLSVYTSTPAGTTAFIAGFADKGPTDEVLEITTLEEFESIYGLPTNAAESYFYYAAKQLYAVNANVLAARLPYGKNKGEGFGNNYGALIYPIIGAFSVDTKPFTDITNSITQLTNDIKQLNELISSGSLTGAELSAKEEELEEKTQELDTATKSLSTVYNPNKEYELSSLSGGSLSGLTSTTSLSSANLIYFGEPKHIDLSTPQYQAFITNDFKWSDNINDMDDLSNLGAGMIVLNTAQSTINDKFEGYYIGFADNQNMEPGSPYDAITSIQSINKHIADLSSTDDYVELPSTRINFELSAKANSTVDSISEVMENIPSYSIFGPQYTDMATLGLFKIRKSVFSPDVIKLDYVLQEAYAGSFDYWRTELSQNGGNDKHLYFTNQVDNESSNIKVLINDNLSNKKTQTWLDINGYPTKKVRFDVSAHKLFPIGSYSSTVATAKTIGSVVDKIERVLAKVEDPELIDIDLVLEAGLGTIFVYTAIGDGRIEAGVDELKDVPDAANIFDDTIDVTKYISNNNGEGSFYNTSLTELTGSANQIKTMYNTIYNIFNNFAEKTRKDCIALVDPLRFTSVKGANTKILQAVGVNESGEEYEYNFSQHHYWPLRYQFMAANSSYSATYNTWGKVYDTSSDNYIWIPPSSIAAAIIVNSSSISYPWFAPAGLNRGIITTVDDISVYANQKQRDQLYKISINPIAYFPNDGIVVWGQKTLLSKTSAFDRINVRRLFLYLERAISKVLRYYVFEPNNYYTRTQVLNTIDPTFRTVKTQQGINEYRLVCSGVNNTDDVINNNELVLDMYIDPTRSGEYILANFYATRSGEVNVTETTA